MQSIPSYLRYGNPQNILHHIIKKKSVRLSKEPDCGDDSATQHTSTTKILDKNLIQMTL